MKFKTRLVSIATVAMFGLGLATKPANAASTSCWLGNRGQKLEHFDCYLNRRINYNGHVVWDVSTREHGKLFTFVLWGKESDTVGLADFIVDGKDVRVRWHEDREGDIRLTGGKGQLAIRFPGYRSPSGSGVAPAGVAYGDMFQR